MSEVNYIPFDKAFINVPVGKYKIQENSYLQKGDYKIVDQGKSLIAGYSNEKDFLKTDFPYILFGDHTKVIKYIDFPFIAGADGVRLYKASENFEPKFLYHFLRSISLPSDSYGRHSKYLEELLVPELNISKQQVIVEYLDNQLSEIEKARDAIEIQRSEIVFLKNRLRQNAFEELLEKYERSYAFKDVCTISAGGTPSRGNSSYFLGTIPWVKTLDLNFGLVTDTQEKISEAAFKSIRGELLPKGTVLVAMYGGAGTIGKSGILGIEACTNQAIAAMQPKQGLLTSNFLHEWLCYIRPEWMQFSSGNRKDPNINKAVVEDMTIPLPSLQEQNLITNSIAEALLHAKSLEQAVVNQHKEITSIASKILAEAFNEIEHG